MTRVYQRSALLAFLGAAFSLLISFAQAKRLVRPIITLQDVVGQVASGNLSARAEFRTGDEVEDLAHSFNSMADTILHRNRILESVRLAGQRLLSEGDLAGIIENVLAKVGQAMGASRACIFENHLDPGGDPLLSERYEWSAPGIGPTMGKWQNFRWAGSSIEAWRDRVASGSGHTDRRTTGARPGSSGSRSDAPLADLDADPDQ